MGKDLGLIYEEGTIKCPNCKNELKNYIGKTIPSLQGYSSNYGNIIICSCPECGHIIGILDDR